ncbi:tetratricopeptide repeat protein [bacterium]|nr:tetratricopeptide repeat protein [bacterium]
MAGAILVFAAVVGTIFASPMWRLWGVDGLYGLTPIQIILWLGISVAAGGLLGFASSRFIQRRTNLWIVSLYALAAIVLLTLFPAATLLRGDGQLIVLSSGEGSKFAPLYYQLAKALSGPQPSAETVWTVFRWIDLVALLGYALAWWVWVRDDDGPKRRLLTIVTAFGIGSVPLLAGLVEHYALLHMLVAWACVLVWRANDRPVYTYIALGLVLLTSALHAQGLVLLPAFLLLLPIRSGKLRWGLWLATMAAGLIAAAVWIPDHVLAPLGSPPPDGYTLFAPTHLLDLLNLILWAGAVPVFVLLPWLLQARSTSTGGGKQSNRLAFYATATVAAFGFATIFSPDLGMARDADLVSLWAVPLTFLLFGYARERSLVPRSTFVALAVVVALMTVGAQTLLQHHQYAAEQRHERALLRNPGRAPYGWEVLAINYRDAGRTNDEYHALTQAWELSGNPRYAYRMAQIDAWERNDTPSALTMAGKAANADPPLPAAQGFYGRLLLSERQYDDALHWLQTAISNGSREDMDFVFLTDYYLGQHDLDSAAQLIEAGWKQAVNHTGPYYVMAGQVAKLQGDPEQAAQHYNKAATLDMDEYWTGRLQRGMAQVHQDN